MSHIFKVRVPDEVTRARWDDAAKKAGAPSTADFIRDAVEAKIEGRQAPPAAVRVLPRSTEAKTDFKKGAR